MGSAFINKTAARVTLLGLLLWLVCPGCLRGCESGALQPAAHDCRTTMAETALTQPLAASSADAEHACCRRAETAGRREEQPPTNESFIEGQRRAAGVMDCCALMGAGAPAAALRRSVQPASHAAFTSERFAHTAAILRRPARLSPTRHIPDGSATHLRCCVFLI